MVAIYPPLASAGAIFPPRVYALYMQRISIIGQADSSVVGEIRITGTT